MGLKVNRTGTKQHIERGTDGTRAAFKPVSLASAAALNAATLAAKEAAEAARDEAVNISGLVTTDDVMRTVDADPESEFRQQADARQLASIAQKAVPPRYTDLDPGEPVAPLTYVNVLDLGAQGLYGSSAHDDTDAFQAAIDRVWNEGGGEVRVPAGLRFRIEQIALKEGVVLRGVLPVLGGVSPAIAGSKLLQAEGSSVDMIIGTGYTDPGGGTYLHACGLQDLLLYGNAPASPSGKNGFAAKDAGGTGLKWQHGCFIDNVMTFGFQEDGIWLPGGSGIQHISHVHGHMNGGYAIHIVGTNPDDVQHVHLIDISGDGNNGGAVVRIEGQTADYQTTITGLKSEQVINFLVDPVTTPSGSVVSNANALQLHNCESDVVVTGLQHIAGVVWSVVGGTVDATAWTVTGGTKTKPGPAIEISNSNNGKRPFVMYQGKKIRSQAAQTGGAAPAWIHDITNGGNRLIPNDHISGMYGGNGAATMVVREQTPGNSRHVFGVDGDHTQPVATTHELAVRAPLQPGFHAFARDAAAGEKSAVFRNAGDGRIMIRALLDDGTTAYDAITFKGVNGVPTEWGLRGLRVAFPTYTQTYSAASRTVEALTSADVPTSGATNDQLAAAINAIRVDLLSMKKNDNAVVDDLQGNGIFK